MEVTSDTIFALVKDAFEFAWNNKSRLTDNSKRSSYFVSQLSKRFSLKFNGEALVQKTDKLGKKTSGVTYAENSGHQMDCLL